MFGLSRGRSLAQQGRYGDAVRVLEPVVADRKARGKTPLKIAQAAYWLGSALVMSGDTQRGIDVLEKDAVPNLELARARGSELYGSALYALGYALCQKGGRGRQAQQLLRDARAALRESRASLAEARCINHLAQALLDDGCAADAAALVDEACEVLSRLKLDPTGVSYTIVIRNRVVASNVKYFQRRYKEARELAKEADAMLARLKAPEPFLRKDIDALLARRDGSLVVPAIAAAAAAAIAAAGTLVAVM